MKKIKVLIFLVAIMFINLTFVSALSQSLGPITQVGSAALDDCGTDSCYGMGFKVAGSTAMLCTDYYELTPAGKGVTCTISNDWSEKVRYGVAAIINKAKSGINASGMTNQYFAAELAVNEFLDSKGVGGAHIYQGTLTSTYSGLFGDYVSAANSAYNSYDADSSVSIGLSTTNLTFTLSGSNYVSNTVTVSGVSSYNVTTNVGTISKSGNTFSVVVPASSLNSSTTVNVSVSSSKSLIQARNYNCGSAYQSLTPVALDTITKSDSKSLSGTINPKAKLIINKVDVNNAHLSGATITVTGTKGYNKTFTTTGLSIVIDNLEYDTYTITEVKAPLGYVVVAPKSVTLSSSNLTATVTLTDDKNKISISKLDVTGKSELPGATLQVQDVNGEILYEWVSTTTPYIIEGIKPGKYYLIETIAPTGYVLSKEKIEFIITEDTVDEVIKMTNKLNSVKISKINAVDKKLLPGAVLEIQDEEGKVVKFCTDEKGNSNKECRWTTTTDIYEIKGMPAGKYYLVEVSAPEGYVLNEEKIEFNIKNTDEVIKVEMINELEVKVPDTLSSKSALLLAIAMFDIALGIGIVTYVKKNKIEQ